MRLPAPRFLFPLSGQEVRRPEGTGKAEPRRCLQGIAPPASSPPLPLLHPCSVRRAASVRPCTQSAPRASPARDCGHALAPRGRRSLRLRRALSGSYARPGYSPSAQRAGAPPPAGRRGPGLPVAAPRGAAPPAILPAGSRSPPAFPKGPRRRPSGPPQPRAVAKSLQPETPCCLRHAQRGARSVTVEKLTAAKDIIKRLIPGRVATINQPLGRSSLWNLALGVVREVYLSRKRRTDRPKSQRCRSKVTLVPPRPS